MGSRRKSKKMAVKKTPIPPDLRQSYIQIFNRRNRETGKRKKRKGLSLAAGDSKNAIAISVTERRHSVQKHLSTKSVWGTLGYPGEKVKNPLSSCPKRRGSRTTRERRPGGIVALFFKVAKNHETLGGGGVLEKTQKAGKNQKGASGDQQKKEKKKDCARAATGG